MSPLSSPGEALSTEDRIVRGAHTVAFVAGGAAGLLRSAGLNPTLVGRFAKPKSCFVSGTLVLLDEAEREAALALASEETALTSHEELPTDEETWNPVLLSAGAVLVGVGVVTAFGITRRHRLDERSRVERTLESLVDDDDEWWGDDPTVELLARGALSCREGADDDGSPVELVSTTPFDDFPDALISEVARLRQRQAMDGSSGREGPAGGGRRLI